jgi:hypothetical protein
VAEGAPACNIGARCGQGLQGRPDSDRSEKTPERKMNVRGRSTCAAPNLTDRGPQRGTAKLLIELGYRVLREFRLGNGRRADVIGIDDRAGFVIAEVKSSFADYRADGKWPAYVGYCDHFYFAVGPGFPVDVLPADVGIIIADGYAGAVLRPAPLRALAAARRKALLVRFARTASSRLVAITDEALLAAEPTP